MSGILRGDLLTDLTRRSLPFMTQQQIRRFAIVFLCALRINLKLIVYVKLFQYQPLFQMLLFIFIFKHIYNILEVKSIIMAVDVYLREYINLKSTKPINLLFRK